jgi:hypothetical protein
MIYIHKKVYTKYIMWEIRWYWTIPLKLSLSQENDDKKGSNAI